MNAFVSLFIVILSLLAANCASTDRLEEKDSVQVNQADSVKVETAIVSRKRVTEEIRCEGRIISGSKKIISTSVSGRISRLQLRPGSILRPGDLLFQLDTTFLQMALTDALLEKEEAGIRLEEKLASRPSGDTLQGSVLQRWELICGVPQSIQKVRRARKELLGATGRATGPGRVGSVFVWEGQSVAAGEKIAEYHPKGSFEVELSLSYLPADLAPGKQVLIQVYPDSMPFTGIIHRILPQVNEKGLFVLYAKLPNQHLQLYEGQRVTGLIMDELSEKIPVIPVGALTSRSGRTVVFKVHRNQAEWMYVTTGRRVDEEIQVLEGLAPGDTVVISGQQFLGHRSLVRIDNQGHAH